MRSVDRGKLTLMWTNTGFFSLSHFATAVSILVRNVRNTLNSSSCSLQVYSPWFHKHPHTETHVELILIDERYRWKCQRSIPVWIIYWSCYVYIRRWLNSSICPPLLSLHVLSVNPGCDLFFSQIPLPSRGRSSRPLTSATRLKLAVSWTSTLRTLPWTKVRPDQFLWTRAGELKGVDFSCSATMERMLCQVRACICIQEYTCKNSLYIHIHTVICIAKYILPWVNPQELEFKIKIP